MILALDPLSLDGVGLAAPSWGLRPQTQSPSGSLALGRPTVQAEVGR
ncbi:MAG: hypothetical protein OSA99_11110 [Acidimicrobiales bacterium]|nr:hypothetical protein [Acidimicrobiales bacterium]